MAFYNHFPDTDFQSINLDKIVQKIGDIDRAVESSEASAEAAARSADNAEDSAAFAQDSATAAAASAEQASATADIVEENKDEILNAVPDLQRQINVNSGRIDELAQLPEGSTAGDAELADIRIGANGVTYNTAGNAVRGQFNQLDRNLNVTNGRINATIYQNMTIDTATGQRQASTNRSCTGIIETKGKDVLIVLPANLSVKVAARYYDANDNITGYGSYDTATRVYFNNGAPKVAFAFGYANDAAADAALSSKVAFFLLGDVNTPYHGRIIFNGSSCFECKEPGYYSFALADRPLISDMPGDITSGGILLVYNHAANSALYQEVMAVNGKRWARVGSAAFRSVEEKSTTINPTWTKGALVASTGAEANSSFRFRSGQIPSSQGVKFIVPDDMELNICAYAADGTHVKSWTMTTGTQYHFPVRTESYCRVFGGYIDHRTVQDDAMAQAYGQHIGVSTLAASGSIRYFSLGDSITEGYYAADDAIIGTTPNNYPTYAAMKNGWMLRNYGNGGTGYIHATDTLPNARDLVDTINFANCDVCTLAYGVNDWHYNQQIGTVNDSPSAGNTMASNMKYCIQKILTDNPRCRLNIMLPLNCSAYGGTIGTDWGLGTSLPTSGTLQHVVDVIKGIAEYYHLPIIDQTETGIVNRYNINNVLGDGIHPTLELYKPYGERIADQIV